MPKVSVIGAGAVGATLAQRIIESSLADVVLVDILKNVAQGKAMDMSDASPIIGHERRITGTDDFKLIASSDIVVITAGLARRPGMTREDLVAKNAAIVRTVSLDVKRNAPESIVIVVTNPLDAMTYLALKTLARPRAKVFGMAGVLDSSRMSCLIAEELGVDRRAVEALVLGSHGDTMVPLISRTRVSGKPVTELLNKEKIDAIVRRTQDRGAEIVSLLGSGSAYYSPSAAVFRMVNAILKDTKEELVASSFIDGEYGLKNICIGVPCVIGRSGIEKITEVELAERERNLFLKSAEAIRKSIELL